jgi:acetate kinase
MLVLTVNAGSSSVKAALFDVPTDARLEYPFVPIWSAAIEEIDGPTDEVVRSLLQPLWEADNAPISGPQEIVAVGHRVVHGGSRLTGPTVIDDAVTEQIQSLAALAPTHNPANLVGITAARALLPNAVHVAVFDTGFHATMPAEAFTISGPKSWAERGIRRYGFHGVSHEFISRRVAFLEKRPVKELRIGSCHLGNGCSLAAIDRGQSVDTTMGFTPLDGLVMGSRSGSVDPGALIHLLREGMSVDDLDTSLNHDSGLLGLSGVSNDMRAVHAAADNGNADAQLAIDVFVHRLRSLIGAMAASMGGLDTLVFTGGIGEKDARIRIATAQQLAFIGVELDESANRAANADANISAAGSPVSTWVIHTEENWSIARSAAALAANPTVK